MTCDNHAGFSVSGMNLVTNLINKKNHDCKTTYMQKNVFDVGLV